MEQKTLGKYKIESLLGSGTYADVYKAVDTNLHRTVALKVLKPQYVSSPEALQRFVQEARTLARLHHERIAWIWDMGEADGRNFLAMRYVDGDSLEKKLQDKGKLSWGEALSIVDDVSKALTYVHNKKMIHRDVKPGNILMTSEGRAVLSDFGLVKVIEGSLVSGSVNPLGTLAYMAPEVLNGEPATPAADQFSLACVLVEMLTGKGLYAAPTPEAVITKHFLPLELPKKWSGDVPEGLGDVLARAMARKPEDRFVDVKAFSTAIKELSEPKKPKPIVRESSSEPGLEKLEKVSFTKEKVDKLKPNVPSAVRKDRKGKLLKAAPLLVGLVAVIGLGVVIFSALKPDPTKRTVETVSTKTVSANVDLDKAIEDVPTVTPRPTKTVETDAGNSVASTETPEKGSTKVSEVDGMEMVYVPAGKFIMGSSDGEDDEQPVHEVYLDGYWIDKYEVTNAQFSLFVEATNHETEAELAGQSWVCVNGGCEKIEGADWAHPVGPDSGIEYLEDHPVVHVSWVDALFYCDWAGRRLPTEAEWEKAARGTDERIYPWGDEPPNSSLLNYDLNEGITTPVGSYLASDSPFGAVDMAGNVWEWTLDWYDEDFYEYSPDENPIGPEEGEFMVLRGGSWMVSGEYSRSTARGYYFPKGTDANFGFRCMVSP